MLEIHFPVLKSELTLEVARYIRDKVIEKEEMDTITHGQNKP
jgi:hypothetical protein